MFSIFRLLIDVTAFDDDKETTYPAGTFVFTREQIEHTEVWRDPIGGTIQCVSVFAEPVDDSPQFIVPVTWMQPVLRN